MPQRAKAFKCLENEQSSINFYIENTLHFKIFRKNTVPEPVAQLLTRIASVKHFF